MSAAERWSEEQAAHAAREDEVRDRTDGPIGGEEPEDLPPAKYRDFERSPRDPVEARAEQVREMDTAGSTFVPDGLAMTDAQGRGFWVGGAIGGAIGAVLLGLLGLLPLVDLDLPARVALFALGGFLAGSTAGAVFLGGRMPELEGEASPADQEPGDSPDAAKVMGPRDSS